MTLAYFDTSAVIRFLMPRRAGHFLARQAWQEADEVASIELVYAETRAALAAAYRNRDLSAGGFTRSKERWEALWSQLTVLDVRRPLVVSAGEMAEIHHLRGYDAVHLAAAEVSGSDLLVSADDALCRAGRRLGMAVLNLNGRAR
jgi:predicted nucleic acid-binding protein